MRALATSTALAVLAACATPPRESAVAERGSDDPRTRTSRSEPAPTARRVEEPLAKAPAPALVLPAGWRTIPRERFEAELARAAPIAESRRVDRAELDELAAALDPASPASSGEIAARAALLLARSRDAAAADALLAALERRTSTPDDAALLVAAWGVGRMPPRRASARLAGLVHGQRPHPRFLVRLECAAAALAIGQETVLPWLVDVLRLGATKPAPEPAGGADAADVAAAELAHAQRRAAALVAQAVGGVARYEPWGAVAERAAEVARLDALVAEHLASGASGASRAADAAQRARSANDVRR